VKKFTLSQSENFTIESTDIAKELSFTLYAEIKIYSLRNKLRTFQLIFRYLFIFQNYYHKLVYFYEKL